MRYLVGAAGLLLCLLFAMSAPFGLSIAGGAWAGDMQTASVSSDGMAGAAAPASRQIMSPLPRLAQMRCPAGQLV